MSRYDPEGDIRSLLLASNFALAAYFIHAVYTLYSSLQPNLSGQNHTDLGGTNVHEDDTRAGGGIRSFVEQPGR
jgi:hypothetical protein